MIRENVRFEQPQGPLLSGDSFRTTCATTFIDLPLHQQLLYLINVIHLQATQMNVDHQKMEDMNDMKKIRLNE